MITTHPSLDRRRAGVLLHLTSLPGPHGIGDLGRPSLRFMNWLERSGWDIWQTLPIGPVGEGDSPYSSGSSFAIEPLLVSLDALVDDGLLPRSALKAPESLKERSRADYAGARRFKAPRWRAAFERFIELKRHRRKAYEDFLERSNHWLTPWCRWATEQHGECEDEHAFKQFVLDRQWTALRKEARRRHLTLFGDLPIFVPMESADVASNPELFQLNRDGTPTLVSGTPPDCFSRSGQLWGHPQYRWSEHRKTGYRWWVSRMKRQFELFDLVRIDHFVGLCHAWMIPGSARTARRGAWRNVPGRELLEKLHRSISRPALVAEDLGRVTPSVRRLREDFALPGMFLLQHAFDGDASESTPHALPKPSVVYTGTHDNDTTVGWWNGLSKEQRKRVIEYGGPLGRGPHELLTRLAMTSNSNLAIIPMQDLLGTGKKTRMNIPGIPTGNWRWRLEQGMLDVRVARRMRRLAAVTDRLTPH
ncbi:MAG TPA: 4-alpha-glucanotransferase [Phycisphaerales bacterium]|nr:4-alpha-glucanotransferase [Phycisphaerales bacterium]